MKSTLIVVTVLAATLAAPAHAAIFGAQLQFSTGVNRPVAAAAAAEDDSGICGSLFGNLQVYEAKADANSGTPSAAKWSAKADTTWAMALDHGCSWAQ